MADGIELYKSSDDLRRVAGIWASCIVAGREAASTTIRFAGL